PQPFSRRRREKKPSPEGEGWVRDCITEMHSKRVHLTFADSHGSPEITLIPSPSPAGEGRKSPLLRERVG
ncbi:hypothetical protein, partial [Spirulina sp.]|uniref:hypothetical protein n=1 Tax=Spirulina sp. TaxID=1157 RepID=UPI003F6F74AD